MTQDDKGFGHTPQTSHAPLNSLTPQQRLVNLCREVHLFFGFVGRLNEEISLY
jgi:hypothetical protein